MSNDNEDLKVEEEDGGGAAEVAATGVTAGSGEAAPYAGWAYLAFLFAIFLALALFAYASDGDSSGGNIDDQTDAIVSDPDADTDTDGDGNGDAAEPVAVPVALTFEVSGDTVTLTGAVPDTGAQDQLVTQARQAYGPGNVIDELTIDESTTLAGGTIRVVGDALDGDTRPDDLLGIVSGFGGADASMDVNFIVQELAPADVEIAVAADGTVRLIGVVPDDASRVRLVANAEEIYGAANVDSTGLTVADQTTWDGGQIRVTGLVDPGDSLAADLQVLLERDNAGVAVSNEVVVDDSAEALGRIQDKLREELTIEPILFATGRSSISSASDAILQRVASAISSVPDIPVEIVGHTDSQGPAASNQALSEERANAVMARLVELGVDAGQLSARGAGEAEPIASNNSSSGRQQNRRIEFIFEGASTDG